MKKSIWLTVFVILGLIVYPSSEQALPKQEVKLLASFEDAKELDNWAGNTEISLSDRHPTEGKKSLKVLFTRFGSLFEVKSGGLPEADFRGWEKLKFDIYNEGVPVVVTLKVWDKESKSYQSWYYLIRSGFNIVEYVLDGFASALDISQIDRFHIRVDQEMSQPTTLYVDNIRLTKGPEDDSWLVPKEKPKPEVEVPGNLIENGDFELGFEHWGSWGQWDGGEYTFGSGRGEDVYSGVASAAIICQRKGRGGIFTEPMKLPAGRYDLVFYLKGKDGAIFRPYVAEGRILNEKQFEAPSDWQKVEYKVEVLDSNKPIRVYLMNVGTGILYLDSVSLVREGGGAVGPEEEVSGVVMKPRKVTTEGEVTYLDGKPFFPIGIYGSQDPEKELKGTAFNIVTSGAVVSAKKSYLDSCAKAGYMSLVELSGVLRAHLPTQAPKVIAKLKNHPAVFGWYICDEPDHAGWNVPPPEIRLASKLVKQEDKNQHPTMVLMMAWAPSNIYQYQDTADILASDPYCIKEQRPCDLLYVSRATDTLKKASKGKKPIWVVLQAIEPEPTREEEYCMTYLALTHGANGIFWFELQYALQHPNLWQAIKDIANELKELAPVLNSPTASKEVKVEDENIHFTLKQMGTKFYLITVSSSPQPISGLKIRLPWITKNLKAQVLFENRRVPIENGVLIDDFNKYERHVYEISM